MVVCRSSICDKYEENKHAKRKSIGGMKGQSKWLEDCVESARRTHEWNLKEKWYDKLGK